MVGCLGIGHGGVRTSEPRVAHKAVSLRKAEIRLRRERALRLEGRSQRLRFRQKGEVPIELQSYATLGTERLPAHAVADLQQVRSAPNPPLNSGSE